MLTSTAFLVGDERGSWLHLQLGQCLVQLNRFAIVDQIQACSEVRAEFQNLLLQFLDGISAPHNHWNLHAFWAIEDIHRKEFRTWWNWPLNLENGVGGVFQRLMVGNRHGVFGVSFNTLPGSTCFTLKQKVLSLKENQDICDNKTNIRLDTSDNHNTFLLKVLCKMLAYYVQWLSALK